MNNDLMMGGLNELALVKQKLIELGKFKDQIKDLDADENKLEKRVFAKEKSIENEISQVTRERSAQIEATYDEQIDGVRARLKKVQASRDKTKNQAIAERIATETADLKVEDHSLKLGGKSIFKQENIPFIYNNRLFYALYFPSGFVDICIILITLALLLFVIPYGVYSIWFYGMSILFLALFYIIIIIVFGGLYLIVGKTKYKHLDALDKVREMRRKLYDIKRQQKRIQKQIRRDKNESGYGLEQYNHEIEINQTEINKLIQQKKAALDHYDQTTLMDIKRQIIAGNQADLDDIKAEHQKIHDQNVESQRQLTSLASQIASDYEGYLGKDFMSVAKIEQLEHLIASDAARNIGEALAQIKQKK